MKLQFKIVCHKDLDIQGPLVLPLGKLAPRSEPFKAYSLCLRGDKLGLTLQDAWSEQ